MCIPCEAPHSRSLASFAICHCHAETCGCHTPALKGCGRLHEAVGCSAVNKDENINRLPGIQPGIKQQASLNLCIYRALTLCCIWRPWCTLKSNYAFAVNAGWHPLNQVYLQEAAMLSVVRNHVRQLALSSQLNKLIFDCHLCLLPLEFFAENFCSCAISRMYGAESTEDMTFWWSVMTLKTGNSGDQLRVTVNDDSNIRGFEA